jgi:hypothetical protein
MSDRVRRSPGVLVVGVAAVAALVIIGVILVGSSDPGGDVGGAPLGAAPTPADVSIGEECESTHAGHNLMMWNPVMADEMLDADCPWPYPPFDVAAEGDVLDDGAPATPPFEPRRYAELWTMLGGVDVGVCEVRSLPDPPADGFAFGFVYVVAEPGCADPGDAVELQVREYVSAMARDRGATQADRPLVLGRWVIVVDGGDEGRRSVLRAAVSDLGAVEP